MKDVLRKIFGISLILILMVTVPAIQSDSLHFLKDSDERQLSNESKIEPIYGRRIIYVDDDSTCPGNGTIWWPYCRIQYAIENASDGDTIFVFCGSYDNGGSWIKIFDFESLELIGEDRNCVIIDAEGLGGGFYLHGCANVYLSNFTIQNTGTGMSDVGIALENCDNCRVSDCIVINCPNYGVSLQISNNNVIEKCYIQNCSNRGLLITFSNGNKIFNSTINNTYCVQIRNSTNNIIAGNTISNNRFFGLFVELSSSHNRIFCNNFINNKFFGLNVKSLFDALDLGRKNQWDDGIKGNYWANCIGLRFPKLFDQDEDGIRDIPKRILIFGIDNFPLMNPYHHEDNLSLMKQKKQVIDNSDLKDKLLPEEYIEGKNAFDYAISKQIRKKGLPLTFISRKTIYVDDDSIYPGNGTIWWPYKYIWQGIENASDGDIIRVYAGIYHERLTVNKKLSIIGNGSGTTVIDGEGKTVVKITSDDTIFTGFGVVNGSRGILVDSAINVSISENDLSLNEGDGIFMDSSSGNFIKNNSILKNGNTGIWLFNTGNTRIENNSINGHSTYPGVYIQRSSGNYFLNNDVCDNAGGITLSESSNSAFFGNIIRNNSIRGILIEDNSNNNRIYGNHLIKNGQWYQRANAWDACTNYWDNGHPGNDDYVYTSGDPWCGNKWSDHWFGNKDEFRGPNQDIPGSSDGIADVSYQIPGGNNVDEYPILYGNDSNPPICTIREPEPGFVYIFGKKLQHNFGFLGDAALVIGPCRVEVFAEDDSGMEGVNFYWDTTSLGVPDASDTPEFPGDNIFNAILTRTKFFKHELYVVPVDVWGNANIQSMPVWIFNIWLPS